MTPPHRTTDSDHRIPPTPTAPAPSRQHKAEQKAAAKIDPDEFWRRLGL